MDSGAASQKKKLKREAAQRRKAQARSLKLHAEEQERLQRLEIDALVEQQRLQRLERQKREEKVPSNVKSTSSNEEPKPAKVKNSQGGVNNHIKHDQLAGSEKKPKSTTTASTTFRSTTAKDGPLPGKKDSKASKATAAQKSQQEEQPYVKSQKQQQLLPKAQQQHQDQQQQNQLQQQQQQQQLQHLQQMRAVLETRRRLARGSRGGSLMATPTLLPDSSSLSLLNSTSSAGAPPEDHRVISTEYQAAGTQALMRVTLLAAGFVIGARGISARLIGQITGAIIQSWTDSSSCRTAAGIPIRLFRIQGKKAVVQAAVALVEAAVAKYRELCECKRRGEFVQREHLISGVEFYYQPPPRKAFASLVGDSGAGVTTVTPSVTTTSSTSTTDVPSLVTSLAFPPHHVWLHHFQQKQKHAQMQKQAAEDLSSGGSENSDEKFACSATASATQELSCLEQVAALDSDRLQAEVSRPGTNPSCSPAAWTDNPTSQTGSSLFSIFGNGGLPLPIAHDSQQHPSTAPPFLKTSVSSTPFDFPKYDFFREILPSFPVAQQQPPPRPSQQRDEFNLYSTQHFQPRTSQQAQEFCMVCVEKRSSARLMTCGHASFCTSCVQELSSCPVCREKVVGWQPLRSDVYDLWNLVGSGTTSSKEACL